MTLTQLGQPAPAPSSPDAATLERVLNPHSDTSYVTRFVAPEFTSICPVTGQPDCESAGGLHADRHGGPLPSY
jgi:7-cyano-7-deazaguanine reductase